jgi:DNA-directed RNA polymerase subunit K/omega
MMEKNINEERALSKDCKYSFVMVVVKRAKQLRRKAKEKNIPFDEIATVKTNFSKPLSVALEEFNVGNIRMKLKASLDDLEEENVIKDVETKTPEGEGSISTEEKESEIPAETA